MSTGRVVYVESGIRGSRRLRFLLLSLRSLLVDQSLVFFEEFPAFALRLRCLLFSLCLFLRGSEAYDLREVKGDHSEAKTDLKVQLTRK